MSDVVQAAIIAGVTAIITKWLERRQASQDRELADRVLDTWELLSQLQQRQCLPSSVDENPGPSGANAGRASTGKPSTVSSSCDRQGLLNDPPHRPVA